MSSRVRSPERCSATSGLEGMNWGRRFGGPVYDVRCGTADRGRGTKDGDSAASWSERRAGVHARKAATDLSREKEHAKCRRCGIM